MARFGQRRETFALPWVTFGQRGPTLAPPVAAVSLLLYSVAPSRYLRRAHSCITMPAATVTGRE